MNTGRLNCHILKIERLQEIDKLEPIHRLLLCSIRLKLAMIRCKQRLRRQIGSNKQLYCTEFSLGYPLLMWPGQGAMQDA